ncbi:MAG: hypothetical protein IKQ60_00450 [Candidatus Methanomethylophilaceae archaeon]|nr:hypothetical protein [Candidatus Methanomethylophilaceae archaeon]
MFRNNQEFYKAPLFCLMDVYKDMEIQIYMMVALQASSFRVRSSFDEEIDSIRRELERNGSQKGMVPTP